MLLPALCLVSLTIAAAVERSPYETARYTGHKGPVTSVVFAPGGEVVSAGLDGTVRRWDAKTLQDRGEKPIEPFNRPTQVAISPNGDLIAVAGEEDSFNLCVRDYPKASVFNVLGEESGLTSVAFSPDGKWLAVGGLGGDNTIWDVSKTYIDGTFRTSFSDKKIDLPITSLGEVVVFSPDSKVLMTLGMRNNVYTMQMWDALTGKMFGERSADGPALAFAPDTKTVITGRTIWKLVKGQSPVQLDSKHELSTAAYSPDSKWVVTGGVDNRLIFWDLQTGKPIAVVRAHDDAVTSVALSQDGKQLVSASRDGTVRLWDVNKILSDKPLEQPLSKFAKSPKAYDVWRLGSCYTKGIIAHDPKQAKMASLDEAEKRAKDLGIELPPLPETAELSDKMQFLSKNQEQLTKQVVDKLGEPEGKLFQAGLTLPMLQLAIEYEAQPVSAFRDQIFSQLVEETVKEFGLLPVMFERMQSTIAEDGADPEIVADRFRDLMREIDLNLEAYTPKKPAK